MRRLVVEADAHDRVVAVEVRLHHVADDARSVPLVDPGRGVGGDHPNLFRADHDPGPAITAGVGAQGDGRARQADQSQRGGGRRSADHRVEHVGLAQETGQLRIGRGGIELVGRTVLHDPAAPQDGHLVGQRERLVLVVGDQHGGGPGLAEDVARPRCGCWPAVRRRGPRRARRAAPASVRRPGPGPGPLAVAGHLRAGRDTAAPGRPVRPCPAARAPGPAGGGGATDRRPRCRPR